MHHADIYAAIYKAKSSATKIAAAEGCAVGTVSSVIKGESTSYPIAFAIAKVTGLTTAKLWPNKYPLNKDEYKQARKGKKRGVLPKSDVRVLKQEQKLNHLKKAS